MAHNLLLGLFAVLCLAGTSLLQADATLVPAETCPTPPTQLESNTSLLVHTPPNIDYIRYGRLKNIQTVNHANVTELYVTATELYQTLLFLTGTMTGRLEPQEVLAPHTHRLMIIPERDPSTLTGFNIKERLTEDQCMLANFSDPLHFIMLYERDCFEDQLNLTLEDVQDRIVNLLKSLENVTGVPLPSDVDRSANGTTAPPTPQVPTADPSSRNENPGADYGDGDNDQDSDLDQFWSQQVPPLNAPPLSTCETGRPTQVEYIQELWIAVWYLMNDLKESKLELSP